MNRTAWMATLVLGCTLGASAFAQTPGAQAPMPAIPYATNEAALDALRAKPGVTEKLENDWVVVKDMTDHVIWSVTTPGNQWHPSIVKRAFVEKDGGVDVELSIRCGASKDACDELAETFEASTHRLREQMKAQGAGG